MKDIANCYHNWRINIMVFIAMVVLVLATSETTTTTGLILNIVAIMLLTLSDIGLFRMWKSAGKLPELDHITEE